jgi:hypothetical protein
MRMFGRALQHLALLIAPLSILLIFTGGLYKGWQELVMLLGAVCLFMIGRLIEGYARQ